MRVEHVAARKTVRAKVRADPSAVLKILDSLNIQAGLQVVLAGHLADGVIEGVNVTPVRVGALPTAGAIADAGLGQLAAAKAHRGNPNLVVLAARGESRPRPVHVVDEIRIGREVVERRRVPHIRPAQLRLVGRVVIPYVGTLADRELVHQSRGNGVGNATAIAMTWLRMDVLCGLERPTRVLLWQTSPGTVLIVVVAPAGPKG